MRLLCSDGPAALGKSTDCCRMMGAPLWQSGGFTGSAWSATTSLVLCQRRPRRGALQETGKVLLLCPAEGERQPPLLSQVSTTEDSLALCTKCHT